MVVLLLSNGRSLGWRQFGPNARNPSDLSKQAAFPSLVGKDSEKSQGLAGVGRRKDHMAPGSWLTFFLRKEGPEESGGVWATHPREDSS